MKLTNREWQTMCCVLDTRSYRYSDNDDTNSDEYRIFTNIQKRITTSKENSTQRYTKEQKAYLTQMLEDFMNYNVGDGYNEDDVPYLLSMLYKLTGINYENPLEIEV